MAGSRKPSRGKGVRLDTAKAKEVIAEKVAKGQTVASAVESTGYAYKTYEEWRRKDAAFKAKVDQARQLRGREETVRGERLGFEEWRKKYLKRETYWHQRQWIDLLEGREPREVHPSQIYVKGNRNRVLINTPPFHAKTATMTEYVVYRLCMDPSFRVLIISAGQALANSIVYDIQQILTSPDYLELQKAYAPDGGWQADSENWRESQIVFGADTRASGSQESHEKDPNVLALGLESKIYGRRADLIILDDAVNTVNVAHHAKQLTWLRKMAETRLEPSGRLIIVGTRVASVDLYSELMNEANYANGKSPWTHMATPAILEEAQDPKDHVTMWPRAHVPWIQKHEIEAGDACICGEDSCADKGEDGLYARWDGTHLELGPRASNNNTEWALVFQQRSVPEDATFPEHAVQAAINGNRPAGVLKANTVGYPHTGMHGKYVILGVDPALSGFAGLIVYAIDRETEKRYVLQVRNLKAPTKKQLEDEMKRLTEKFGVNEVRVEKTGLLKYFTQDAPMRQWFQTRGIRFTEHYTGGNKWDASFGISSMASLFGEYDKAWDDPNGNWRTISEPLIELPRSNHDDTKTLIHQLITWTPELDPAKTPCDLVMALWFAEIGARDILGHGRGNVTSLLGRSTKFVAPRRAQQNLTINLADYRASSR